MIISLVKLSRSGILPKIKKVSGAQLIYNKLLDHNVKDVFLYSGGSIMPLIDKFYNNKIKYYINTHEQNSGHSATGYAKSTGNIGVVISTSGPGLTNLITPILDAMNDSTPLLVLSGQVGLKNMGTCAFQEAPSVDITKSITKWSYCLKNTDEIPEILDKAFGIANTGKKGPVHIDIPKCILTNEVYLPFGHLNNYSFNDNYFRVLRKEIFNKNKFNDIIKIINKSKNPIFYVGQGSKHASNELYHCIKKSNIPCTSTIHGKGIFPENEELSLKWCGMHGMASANFAIQQSDCIIAIGSRFDDRTTGNTEYYAPIAKKKKQIIHIDIEEKQFNRAINSDYNLLMDSKDFLKKLLPKLESNNRTEWKNNILYLKEKHDFKYNIPNDNTLTSPVVINEINDYLKEFKNNYHITTGVGNHQMMTYQFIEGLKPNRIHSSGSLGVMGVGLPYSIGVQIGNPNDLVIDIDGDSSFMMTMSDLKTIKEYNLPIKIVILNDGKQMMVNIWERLFFNKRYTATINNNNPDFVKLSESFGIKGFYCDNQKDIKNITKEFLNYNGPALCEYKVEGEICLPLVGPGKALDDMILFDEYEEDNVEKFDKSFVPA